MCLNYKVFLILCLLSNGLCLGTVVSICALKTIRFKHWFIMIVVNFVVHVIHF